MRTRPGWQTSEFWVSIVSILLPLILRAVGVEVSGQEMLGMAGAGGAYALSRGVAKRESPPIVTAVPVVTTTSTT